MGSTAVRPTDSQTARPHNLAVGPTMIAPALTAHLLRPVIERANASPGRAVAAYRDGNAYVDVTAAEFDTRIRRLAKGLMATGIRPGQRVALMSHTRLEWLLVDYAILAVGGVTVPVYETSSAEQLQWILSDSGAVAAVFETTEMLETFRAIAGNTPDCRRSLVIDTGDLDVLAQKGAEVDDSELDQRIGALTTDHLASIVYTSGTTGRPKGCVLSHGNLRTNVMQNLDAVRPMLSSDDVSLVFLPLAHTLTKIIALVGIETGIKLAFATDVAHLQEELAIVRPTMVIAVPRVFEKIFDSARQRARKEAHGRLFDKSVDVAIRWSQNRVEGRLSPANRVAHAALARLVYRKLRGALGGRMRFAFSGGGPLGARLTYFFDGIGVSVFEGYGLTETSPTLTVNRNDAFRPGSVGKPLASTSIRIANDGEILVRGPQLFQGYWHDKDATAATFDAGWFKTGDVGTLDSDGFLRITGRKKEIIVTAAGKNVAPAPLEDRLRAHPLISEAVVVGDARPFVAALIVLDHEAVAAWAGGQGFLNTAAAALTSSSRLRGAIQEAVDDANQSVSRAESIREFLMMAETFTIEGGELTPTLKVRRAFVETKYQPLIDALYSAEGPRSPTTHAARAAR